MNLFLLALFCVVFVYSNGDDAADKVLQNFFIELDGGAGVIRDDCVEKTSVEIATLKEYDNVDDVPEKDLCFYKCFYEGIGFLKEDGKFELDAIDLLVALSKQKNIDIDKLKECVKDIDNVVQCTDLVKLEKCFIDLA